MINKLNSFEISLIEKFRAHPIFIQIDAIAWHDFLEILIQRRFLSLSIVNIYEFVIDALVDLEIKQTVRGILNEDYPRNTKGVPLPSHYKDLFCLKRHYFTVSILNRAYISLNINFTISSSAISRICSQFDER